MQMTLTFSLKVLKSSKYIFTHIAREQKLEQLLKEIPELSGFHIRSCEYCKGMRMQIHEVTDDFIYFY